MIEYNTDRPITMTLKDWLVRKMSVDMKISESILHRVVDHQVNGIRKAFDSNNSVEISGFGKFIFSEKKAKRKLNGFCKLKYLYEKSISDPNEPEKKKRTTEFKLHKLILDIEALKKKL